MRNWAYPVIAGLVVLVVIAAVGGYMVGHRAGVQQANAARATFMAQRFGGSPIANTLGQGNPAGGVRQGAMGANGTVKSIEGNTIVVTTRTGDVKVKLGQGTTVQKLAPGSVQDIQPGVRIAVTGDTDSGGTVSARSVQLLPPGE